MRYRTPYTAGGAYYFTINLADRRSDFFVKQLKNLRGVSNAVKHAQPFLLRLIPV